MSIYAIIPAKNKSRRLKNKNFLKFSGKSLYEIVAKNCLLSKCFDKIILSTDRKNLKFKLKDKKLIVDNRPKTLSGKSATVAQVASYIIKKYGFSKKDVFFIIYPTAILIDGNIIRKSFLEFKKKKMKYLMSVQKYQNSPIKALKKFGKLYNPIFKKKILEQTDKNYVFSDGGFYWYKVSYFLKYLNFYPKEINGFVLTKYQNIDLDDKDDLSALKNIIKLNNIKF